MDVIYPRCAGLDVRKQTVVACARLSRNGATRQEVRTFPTTTSGLMALADWLESPGVQHVAMEATGVYWKPASFVPPTATRTRKQFVRERGSHGQRVEKIPENANLKLSSVISDIPGKSDRAVLNGIIDGQTVPQALLGYIG